MKRYELRVKFDAVDIADFKSIVTDLISHSFDYTYTKNVGFPNKMEFVFKGLSAEGVERWKAYWRALNLDGGSFTTVETYG